MADLAVHSLHEESALRVNITDRPGGARRDLELAGVVVDRPGEHLDLAALEIGDRLRNLSLGVGGDG